MAIPDSVRHLIDGVEDILVGQVAEHACANLGSGFAEGLGRVVVAVSAREYWQVSHDLIDGRAFIFKIGLLGLEGLDAFQTTR